MLIFGAAVSRTHAIIKKKNCIGEKKSLISPLFTAFGKNNKTFFFNFLLTDVLLELLHVCRSGRGSARLEQVLSTLCDITESRDVTQM